MYTDINQKSRTLRLSADVSFLIWKYVLRSHESDENFSLKLISFYYSTYHYAVMDILESTGIEKEVMDLFLLSASYLFEFDPSNPFFGIMQGTVESFVSWMKQDQYDVHTVEGARKILKLKSHVIDNDNTMQSFFGYEASDTECNSYLTNVHSLRTELRSLLLSNRQKSVSHSQVSLTPPPKSNSPADCSPPKKHNYFLIFSSILIAVFIIYCFYYFFFAPSPSSTLTAQTPSSNISRSNPTVSGTTPTLKSKTPPSNGKVIKYPVASMVAPLTIKTSGDGYYCFILSKVGTNERTMAFFGHGGKTVNVDVPLGTYKLYFATGSTWYGLQDLFGDETVYQCCDSSFTFKMDSDGYVGWTVTLYPVSNGNMDSKYISADDFPK